MVFPKISPLVWEKGKKSHFALKIFGVQLALNALWSILFFGLRSPALGFAGIVPLWLSIVYSIKLFWNLDRRAAYLLLPYIAWVSFASILNLAIWMLNA
jgi:tryptophan-rich sensory protein